MASEAKPVGVYRNKRLMHACTTIVGFTVHLQTKDGSVWEGIFNTFSPEFTICLNLAIQIDPKLNPKDCLYAALKAGKQAEKQAFFDLKDIVRITVLDVDLNCASVDLAKLTTDADISGFDANKSSGAEHRELESWQDDDVDTGNADSLLSLDDVTLSSNNKNDSRNNGRGWDAQDMFRYNERVYKLTTTYDEKLSDYTLPLPKHNSKDWRKKSERAAAIAKEIEGNTKSQGRLAKEDEGDCEEEKFSAVMRPTPPPPAPPQTTPRQPPPPIINTNITSPAKPNMCHNKNFRPRLSDRERTRIDSLKNFGDKLSLGQMAGQPPSQSLSANQAKDQQSELAKKIASQPQSQSQIPPGNQAKDHQSELVKKAANQSQSPSGNQAKDHQSELVKKTANQTQTPSDGQAKDHQSELAKKTANQPQPPSDGQTKDHQSELAKKSTLNPNAKEFVYKPRSPALNQGSQTNGPNQVSTSVASTMGPPNSSPMSQGPHAGNYYQQIPMFPPDLSQHQQPHHAAQFMPNHAHPHFQNQIHYMSPVHPHFAQQMSQRYIRSNFQNYHHRGEHHNNVRADYSQASMMVPTSTGQPFVPPPPGAPHPMNAYAASPQQPMIYSGPPQSMYPVVQAGFPQHMPHMMPNPPPYGGSTVYMPSQNYIVNP